MPMTAEQIADLVARARVRMPPSRQPDRRAAWFALLRGALELP
jgi:hypothetical protein